MSSTILLDQVLAFVRANKAALGLFDVKEYGGEFSAAEVDFASYNCPAVFFTVLGSRPVGRDSKHLTGRHARLARMAAFVATKGATRDTRMRDGLLIAERVAYALHNWKVPQPSSELRAELGAAEDEPAIENLYGRAIDKEGQALWLLTWQQAYRPLQPPPELVRLLKIDIVDHTHQGVVRDELPPAAPGTPGTLRVTEAVNFEALPPAAP